MKNELLFWVGFSLLLTHELDAVAHSEWRVLPVTSFLPDTVGFRVFVLLHVPIFAWLLWQVAHTDRAVRRRWHNIVSAFLVVHVALHSLFSGHVHYDFNGWMSRLLIFGGGAFGALHLAKQYVTRAPRGPA
jgi:hypothetical protein